MMNNKGVIFSGFMYVLLVFFLLSLSGLLLVLNNSKKISSKSRDGADNLINSSSTEFKFDLKDIYKVCLNSGDTIEGKEEYEVTAVNSSGKEIPVSVSSDFIANLPGTYTYTYTAKDKGKEKSIERKIHVLKNEYNYTGNYEEISPMCDGYYKVELWGADNPRGIGGYTQGVIKLNTQDKLYLYVGQFSTVSNGTSFNGGTASNGEYPGGGATDIRLLAKAWNNLGSLKSRIMVAAGAGAGNVQYSHGGGLVGQKSGIATSGRQTTPGVSEGAYPTAGFGYGGGGCGGGGGYYGGGGAICNNGGAGGSSFISGGAGSNAITNDTTITHTNNTLHFSGKYFLNTTNETDTIKPLASSGSANITYLGKEFERTNVALNNVRYIKDCINGSNVSASTNEWIELQAIKDGINIAHGKVPVGTSVENPSRPYSLITDGITDNITSYGASSISGTQCITIDLGKAYNLDEVAVWHLYDPVRTYNDTFTAVSIDNNTWTTLQSNLPAETPNGSKVTAWE